MLLELLRRYGPAPAVAFAKGVLHAAEVIAEGLGAVARARGMSSVAKASGLSRERVKALMAEGRIAIDGAAASSASREPAPGAAPAEQGGTLRRSTFRSRS